MSKADRKRDMHQRYRQECKKFFSLAKIRRMRTRDGGGKTKNNKVKYIFPPATITVAKVGLQTVGKPYTAVERRMMHHGIYNWAAA